MIGVVVEGLQSWQLDTIAEIKRRDELAEEAQWANAEDMCRLYESGMTQEVIASHIDRTQPHVSYCIKTWAKRQELYNLGYKTFNEAYHSPEVRGGAGSGGAHGKGENPDGDEWYTPQWLFEGLGLVFDIDVAAPSGGVPWIPAEAYFTKVDDGRDQEWYGTVWCNPPYSSITPWAKKWIEHGDGVLLVPFVKSAWLAEVASAAGNLWIPPKGIDFEAPNGATKSLSYMVFLAGIGVKCVEAVERVHNSIGGALR